jgi:murein DD-endopeptidase MepM/ murein hydrolase activator NlpD
MHLVTEGDTLATIAKRYGATPKSIADANQLGAGTPNAGDRLLIPAAYHAPAARPVAQTYASHKRSATQTAAAKRVPVHTTVHTPATVASKLKTTGVTLAQVRSTK